MFAFGATEVTGGYSPAIAGDPSKEKGGEMILLSKITAPEKMRKLSL